MSSIDPSILALILLASRAFGVEAGLICAVIDVESTWNLHALGDYGSDHLPHSFGLMQLHDEGAGYGYDQDLLLNPAANIMIGAEYLAACLRAFPNNVKLGISAYNQGIGGAAEKGYSANGTYVTNVLNQWQRYKEELAEWQKKATPQESQ